jgi:hypothetical protein
MTTKHTPGPWVIGKRDHDVVMVDTASGTAICDVYGESDDRPANARLIAAAPDLLAALEDIARGDYSDPLCMKTPEQRAREAIAKAKGG